MADTVQLTDLDVITLYSIAVRMAAADRDELIATLRADLEWLESGATARSEIEAPETDITGDPVRPVDALNDTAEIMLDTESGAADNRPAVSYASFFEDDDRDDPTPSVEKPAAAKPAPARPAPAKPAPARPAPAEPAPAKPAPTAEAADRPHAPIRRMPAKITPARKPAAKKTVAKKTATRAAAKKTPAKQPAAKKATARKR